MGFSHVLQKITTLLNLIKFSHTIFSFPFAVMSAFLAAGGMPGIKQLLLIIAALVTARSAAMSFNRLVDTHYDVNNPRTTYRVTLQKKIGRTNMWMFTILCAALFFLCAWSSQSTRLVYVSPGHSHHLWILIYKAVYPFIPFRPRPCISAFTHWRMGGDTGHIGSHTILAGICRCLMDCGI